MGLPRALSSVGACLFAVLQADRDKSWAASGEKKFPCAFFPRGVVKCEGRLKPELLSADAYASLWLAEDAAGAEQRRAAAPDSGKKVLIKLFKDTRKQKYLTGADVRRGLDRFKWVSHKEVRNECAVPRAVHGNAPQAWALPWSRRARHRSKSVDKDPAGKSVVGAQRIRRCLGENFGTKAKEEVLYVKMELGGIKTLATFHEEMFEAGHWTLEIARQALKQLLEGLAALESVSWLHHNLSPTSITVQEAGRGKFLLQIVDFGSSVRGKKAHNCDYSPSCAWLWSPPEFKSAQKAKVCRTRDGLKRGDRFAEAFSQGAPMAFDAHSAGLIMLDLLFTAGNGRIEEEIFEGEFAGPLEQPGVYDEEQMAQRRFDGFWRLADALGDPTKKKVLMKWARELEGDGESKWKNFAKVIEGLTEPSAAEFFKKAVELLHVRPTERPSVSSLLNMDWMQDTIVANNPDA